MINDLPIYSIKNLQTFLDKKTLNSFSNVNALFFKASHSEKFSRQLNILNDRLCQLELLNDRFSHHGQLEYQGDFFYNFIFNDGADLGSDEQSYDEVQDLIEGVALLRVHLLKIILYAQKYLPNHLAGKHFNDLSTRFLKLALANAYTPQELTCNFEELAKQPICPVLLRIGGMYGSHNDLLGFYIYFDIDTPIGIIAQAQGHKFSLFLTIFQNEKQVKKELHSNALNNHFVASIKSHEKITTANQLLSLLNTIKESSYQKYFRIIWDISWDTNDELEVLGQKLIDYFGADQFPLPHMGIISEIDNVIEFISNTIQNNPNLIVEEGFEGENELVNGINCNIM
ncbi:Uncharacterised protein [Legionella beliardensis]|uniref:Uncharacterized protein n=1 Tax=Legionella beliardensis TaxID=91822 RepID=A0A378I2R0_9GAMM|nr:hypothetical protein [Legionella beliardensis]STX28956.1 Uncharacterised protein [Legionella beliardensis]